MAFVQEPAAFNTYIACYCARDLEGVDLLQIFLELSGQMHDIIASHIYDHGMVKYFITFVCRMGKPDGAETNASFSASLQYVHNVDGIYHTLVQCLDKILNSLTAYTYLGSGWLVRKVLCVELHVARLLFYGGCSTALPPEIKNRKAVYDVPSPDSMCFEYSILAGLHKNSGHIWKKGYLDRFQGTLKEVYPDMRVDQVPKCEEANKICINIYGYDGQVFIIKLSHFKFERTFNLLLFNHHYFLISNFNRLLTVNGPCLYYCSKCLRGYTQKHLLDAHTCATRHLTHVRCSQEKELKFTATHLQAPVSYIVVCDTEALLPQINHEEGANTILLEAHAPIGYCLLLINTTDNTIERHYEYTGVDAIANFMYALRECIDHVKAVMATKAPLMMTPADQLAHSQATNCGACTGPLGADSVRDHNHRDFAGPSNYRQALHSACNLNFKEECKLPVFAHNLSSYDFVHFLPNISLLNSSSIQVIPESGSKFKAVILDDCIFLDSLKFLPASLESLAKSLLSQGADKFVFLNRTFPDPYHQSLLHQKQFYPYSYMQSLETLKQNHLPRIAAFKNSLTGEELTLENYLHAHCVWTAFECHSLDDYTKLYCLSDTLILADILMNFRQFVMKEYNLEICRFLSLPHFVYVCALKDSGITLDRLTDIRLYDFFHSSIRGGISQISCRYDEANAPDLPGYDPSLPEKRIICLDFTGLYSHCLKKALPYAGFRWLTDAEIADLDIRHVSDDGPEGYFLSVDVEFPPDVHQKMKYLPLGIQKMAPTMDMLSPLQREIAEQNGYYVPNTEKLIAALTPLKEYKVHYRFLKLMLQEGVKLTKIHAAVKFQQKPWLRDFVTKCEDFRKVAKQRNDDFESLLFKLIVNSLYGKFLQNEDHRFTTHLVTSELEMASLISKRQAKFWKSLHPGLGLVELYKTHVVYSRPIYVGVTVLDQSKVEMGRFYYETIQKFHPNHVLLAVDTDSQYLSITQPNLWEVMKGYKHLLDCSNLNTDHPLYSTENYSRTGTMKFDFGAKQIVAFCGLKPKLYAVLFDDNSEKKAAKGVSRSVIQNELTFRQFKQVLESGESQRNKMRRIGIVNHGLFTMETNKISLSAFDNKRKFLNHIESVPFGFDESLL